MLPIAGKMKQVGTLRVESGYAIELLEDYAQVRIKVFPSLKRSMQQNGLLAIGLLAGQTDSSQLFENDLQLLLLTLFLRPKRPEFILITE